MLPTVQLGDHAVTRLIIGGNPFSGNSHQSAEVDEEMMDFFTTERIKETLFRCEEVGINTVQARGDTHIMRILREFYNEGGSLHWIAQTASELRSHRGNIHQIMKMEPAAIYHHGTTTDSLFKAGRYGELRERIEIIRATGRPAGLGTHMPDVIVYAEENGWDLDFYMASLHNLSRQDRVSSAVTGRSNVGEPFHDEDRQQMMRVIRGVDKPCLAFKVLSSGRKCGSNDQVRDAFREVFGGIKKTDGVVVGMFPRDGDQVRENADIVEELLD